MTRLVWIILFAVIIGLLTVFTLRMLQSGMRPTTDALDLAAARRALEDRYPRASFEVRMAVPAEGRRNIVVSVEPRRETADPEAILDNVVATVEEEVDLAGFDSLLVFLDGSLALALPARRSP